jgi:hypothetical protein
LVRWDIVQRGTREILETLVNKVSLEMMVQMDRWDIKVNRGHRVTMVSIRGVVFKDNRRGVVGTVDGLETVVMRNEVYKDGRMTRCRGVKDLKGHRGIMVCLVDRGFSHSILVFKGLREVKGGKEVQVSQDDRVGWGGRESRDGRDGQVSKDGRAIKDGGGCKVFKDNKEIKDGKGIRGMPHGVSKGGKDARVSKETRDGRDIVVVKADKECKDIRDGKRILGRPFHRIISNRGSLSKILLQPEHTLSAT